MDRKHHRRILNLAYQIALRSGLEYLTGCPDPVVISPPGCPWVLVGEWGLGRHLTFDIGQAEGLEPGPASGLVSFTRAHPETLKSEDAAELVVHLRRYLKGMPRGRED